MLCRYCIGRIIFISLKKTVIKCHNFIGGKSSVIDSDFINDTIERIRKSYDHVFDDTPQGDITIQDRHRLDNGYYKKMVMEKYLAGEIDIDMVHTIMTSLEEKNPKKKTAGDPSYA